MEITTTQILKKGSRSSEDGESWLDWILLSTDSDAYDMKQDDVLTSILDCFPEIAPFYGQPGQLFRRFPCYWQVGRKLLVTSRAGYDI